MINTMRSGVPQAVFLLAGTTIGAGIFGIPYVTALVGYPLGVVWLVVLSLAVIIINILYAYVVLRADDKSPHQLVGYAEHYLGKPGKFMAALLILFGQWGALLIYIIGIGEFIAIIVNQPHKAGLFSLLAFSVVGVLTWSKTRLIAVLEGWLTLGMIFVIVLIGVSGFPYLKFSNITAIPVDITLRTFLMPYGVFMGALSGYAIVPEMWSVIKEQNSSWKNLLVAVFIGTLIPVIVYFVFQFVVVGISGMSTSEESIVGLVPFLDTGVIRLGALFGTLAMFSSFLTLTDVLEDTFKHDYHQPAVRAFLLSLFPPLLLYLAGVTSFIVVLELTGIWLGLLSTGLIITMFVASIRKK